MVRFRDIPIGRKLTLLMTVTTSVIVTLSCVGFAIYNYLGFRETLIRDTKALAEIVGAGAEPALDFPNAEDARKTLDALYPRQRILAARLFDRDGQPLASYIRSGESMVELPMQPQSDGFRIEDGKLICFHRVIRDADQLGTVCLVTDVQGDLIHYFWLTAGILAALLGGSFVLTLLVSTKLQSIITAPILELSRVAADVTENKDFSVRAQKHGDDETGLLVDTFNGMLDQIQQDAEELEQSNLALDEHRQFLEEELEEHKRADEALRESEERFRQIAESINEVFWIADVDRQQIIYVSPAYEHVWGCSRDSLYANPKSAMDAIHPDDAERVKTSSQQPNPDGAVEAVYRINRPDGTIRWIRDRAFIVTDDEGKPYRLVGIAEDITERKVAEDSLQRSEARYRDLVETAPDVIFVLETDGSLLSLNPAFEITTGRKVADWVGKPFAPLIHPDDLSLAMKMLQQALQGEKMPAFELRVCAINGEYLTAEFTTSPQMHDGKIVGVLGIGRDITERKRAEVVLAQSEGKFRVLSETVAAGMFIYQNEKIVYVNPAAEAMTGYTKDELLTKNFWDIIHPDHSEMVRERGRARLRGENAPSQYEVKIRNKSGEDRWVLFTAGRLQFQNEPAVLGTAFDITHRKLAEERLRKLQQEQQAILDLAPAFIWYKDCHNRILRLNRSAAESMGKTVAEIEGKQTEEFYPEDAAKYYVDDLEVIRSGKPKLGIVEELLTASGEKRWIQTDKVPFRNGQGSVIGIIVCAVDITERKRTEEALKLQSEIAKNMEEGVVLVRASDAIIIYANPKFERMFGYNAGELNGQPVTIVNAHAKRNPDETAREIINALNETGSWHGEIHNRKKDGTPFWCRANVATFQHPEHGDIWIAVHHDITEQHKSEQALRDAEGKWRSLVENSRDIIIIVNEPGTILYINRVLSGFDNDAVVGTSVYDYVSPEFQQVQRVAIQSVFQGGQPQYYEVQGAGANGSVAWYETRIVPITHEGRVLSAMLISSDISERKRLEKEVLEISDREQQRIGQDLHDGLCQHLVGTSFAAQTLAEKLSSRSPRLAKDSREISELIGQAITHARRIARGLYPVQLEEAGLMSALNELTSTISDLFYVQCEFKCSKPVLLPDNAAAIHLYRIAQEAVNNSLKHGKAKHIQIGLEQTDSNVVLTITDDGVGMPNHTATHEGMGMRIMAYRARLIGATFEASTRPKGGAVVTCHFPVRESQRRSRHGK